ncbi:MAG: hypothetical protein HXX20_22635 [Chloroflexi bacterium]|nr:hypothetical protein [Chloroflexota bacterium]
MKQLLALSSKLQNEERRHSALLRLILLSLILITPFFTLTGNPSNAVNFNEKALAAYIGGYLLLLLAFGLNRAGLVVPAGWLLITALLGIVAVYLIFAAEPISRIQTVGLILILPIIISGMTLGAQAPLVVALVADILLCLIILIHSERSAPNVVGSLVIPIAILFLVGLFTWYFAQGFDRLFRQLTERNQELERINTQIKAQRKLELRVGDRINLLAAQVSASFSEQTRGTHEQLSAVVEVTTALEELNQTNEQIALASGQVASTAHETLDVARRGGQTIRYSTDAMNLLHAKVNEMSNAMENLSIQAREIDQIIELITEVAEETNLLALNATIEAAGAREYGRRFAAVAGEVQRLANRSRDAADAVRLVVNEVQEAIKETTFASQQGLRDALELTSSSREIGEAIEGIIDMVQNTATLAQQISLSIQQQKSAGIQVLDTMRHISNITDQAAGSSQELIHSMYELNKTADQLKSVDFTHPENQPPDNSGSSNPSQPRNLTLNPKS